MNYGTNVKGMVENVYPLVKVGELFTDPQLESADGGHL